MDDIKHYNLFKDDINEWNIEVFIKKVDIKFLLTLLK